MDKREFLKTGAAASMGILMESRLFSQASKSPTMLAQDEPFWAALRLHYPTGNRFINLENGFYCFQPDTTLEAFVGNIRAVNGEASHYMRTRMDRDMTEARKAIARLAGCAVEELIVTRNTTESLDTIINGIDWKPGDEAVMATQDYGSMIDMFALQARRHGMVNRIVEVPLHPTSDEEIVEVYRSAITDRTRLLMVSHIVGGTGQILPVAAICDMAHGLGVQVMVDGAHSFAHLDFHVPDLRCDYYGASLHKWLSAPLGVGMLYVRRDRIAGIWPMFGDGSMPDDDIRKLNHRGTHPVHTDLTLAQAVAFHQAIGGQRKMARLRYLQNYWTSKVRSLPNIQINTPGDPSRSCAIANVGVRGVAPADLAAQLMEKYNIYTVAIDRGAVKGIRVTPQVYTSLAELDALTGALVELSKQST
ncbi:aminotransferase [Sphingobium sp. SCG-1]|uniref:aminotransferase class V-fold PLP-dependent enzyme n=1 Tax=Sphingobium sp. SCG-1 TaxID=2072936 RepID=UPI000CD68A42|nr:aminotransferase class V-fold PLP-dependent enzyme [Sphingobium sp. SCG-1]AUW59587.1 aminotransferase [Sphingobium sp. SCG-1]